MTTIMKVRRFSGRSEELCTFINSRHMSEAVVSISVVARLRDGAPWTYDIFYKEEQSEFAP